LLIEVREREKVKPGGGKEKRRERAENTLLMK
jgi:hypothetical protein